MRGHPRRHRRAVPRRADHRGAAPALAARRRIGEILTAIGMTEPSGGSDLAALKTTAVRDGDDWVINGSKTFITNGYSADLVVVAARTAPEKKATRHHALRRRDGQGGLQPRPQARQGRPGRVRHRRDVLRGPALHRRRHHRRARQRLHPHDAEPAAGAARLRDLEPRARPADPRGDAAVRQGPQGVRPGRRLLPAQQVPARRAVHPGRRHPGLRRPVRGRPRRRRADRRSTPPRRSGGPRRCRTRSSTTACSCTVATAS